MQLREHRFVQLFHTTFKVRIFDLVVDRYALDCWVEFLFRNAIFEEFFSILDTPEDFILVLRHHFMKVLFELFMVVFRAVDPFLYHFEFIFKHMHHIMSMLLQLLCESFLIYERRNTFL